MKQSLRFALGTLIALTGAAVATAQVIRVEITSPINEGAVGYNPGAALAGATATVAPAGQVASIDYTAGSGYTTPPTITLTGGGGTGAAATVTLNTTGGIVVAVTPGSGYTTAPTATLSGGAGGPALVPATVGTVAITPGTVSGIALTSAGAGYNVAPTVTISGGGGSGATANAVVADGKITRIDLTNAGTGYTSAPKITISPPEGIVTIGARVTGTTGFTTQFYVDGKPLGSGTGEGSPEAFWNPPQPGAYFISATASDSLGNSATSQPVRVFVTGAKIFSPLPNTLVPLGSSIVVSADGLFADGTLTQPTQRGGLVRQIEFFVNGASIGVDTTAPYSASFMPPAIGLYNVTATATDNYGNMATALAVPVQAVVAIGSPPVARIANPVDGGTAAAGTAINIIADATDADGFITRVEFYLNGMLLNSDSTFPFTGSWTPAVPGRYLLSALAYDDKGNVTATDPSFITVSGGLPTVRLTSPAAGTSVIQGSKLSVSVSAAGSDGGISSLKKIELLVDGNVNDSLPKAQPAQPGQGTTGEGGTTDQAPVLTEPFVFTWQSNVAVGTHRLAARVTDANNLTITSAEVPVTVIANRVPQVSITTPLADAAFSINAAVTIAAAASDVDGSVESVEFLVNGTSIGTVAKSPYQITWTPTTSGPYELTARARDNAGASVTSSPVAVTVDPSGASGGVASNVVYRGTYGSPTESGRFTLAVSRAGRGTFIGFASAPAGATYFWSDFPIGADGIFSVRDGSNNVVLSGQTSATGVSGTFGDRTFIGPITMGSGTFTPLILTGTLTGAAASPVVTVVGGDGSITVYSATGTSREVGTDFLSNSGSYTITTPAGGRIAGVATAATNVVSGTITGKVNGSFLLQQQRGRLVNISARSLAGTGDRTLVAGFIVMGTGSKPLLVRAVGPSLANFGVANPLADPSVTVQSATATLGSNNDWGNSASLAALATQLGAFPLNPGSRDAAVQVTVPADGLYTAVVSGGTATPAAALVEIYDTQSGGGTARISNISTRGMVGADEPLMAGFVISGDQRKRLLIRAVGPTLSRYGIANPLADPRVEVLAGTSVIAANDNWSQSAATVISTSAGAGAFPLMDGSRDAALVLPINPGSYTVQVTGVGGTTGTVLLEIYDTDL